MTISKIIQKLGLTKTFLKIVIKLHNFTYRKISELAIIENGGIHPKHELMNYHKFFVDNIKKNSKVLDIGCGIGAVAFDVSKKASKVVAVDLNKKNFDIANNEFSAKNIEYVYADATTYDFKEKFDYVILSNVLEHIDKRVEFLKKIKKLAPTILIRVPMVSRGWLPLYLKKEGYEYRLDNAHFIEYTSKQIKDELDKAGWKIKDYYVNFGEFYGQVVQK